MRVLLKYTTSKVATPYQGMEGELTCFDAGGERFFTFTLQDGTRLSLSGVKKDGVLGDPNYPNSPSVSFTTNSGSVYDFENIERERVVDGCFRKGNQFLGFEKEVV